MAGNPVLAKPAEQTPLIGMRMVELLHKAGVAKKALQILPGDGRVGAMMVAHRDVAGVAFTGSTEVTICADLVGTKMRRAGLKSIRLP